MMSVEEMLKFLGVKTQSEESIDLCYLMDKEAFNMMSKGRYDYSYELAKYEAVYELLKCELGYIELDQNHLMQYSEIVDKIDLTEEDKDFRDQHFTGLERVLLRYNRSDLVGFKYIKENGICYEDMVHDAYLYEMGGDYNEARSLYRHTGYNDREEICLKKSEQNK